MLKRLLLTLLLLLTGLAHLQPANADPLDPNQAFRFSARALDAHTIEARWQIAPEYYLYRDKFRFEAEPASIKLGAAQLPPGKLKADDNFGSVETYHDSVTIRLPVEAGDRSQFTLKARSQGCADMGICYPPLAQQTVITFPASTPASRPAPLTSRTPQQFDAPAPPLPMSTAPAEAPDMTETAPPTAPPEKGDESSRIARLIKDASLGASLLFFLGSGLVLAFTPCMLPMVPILSGIIVGHGHDIGRGRAFALSFAYVIGMALTYAAVGVAAGLSGTLVSAALQNVWFLGFGALIFVLLALSMFGVYELQMPSFLQGRFRDEANRQQGGSLHGVFLMGVISAAIVGPCVAAPLAGALLYIAKTGEALLGGLALFALGLGMGLPLILIGASARHLLPKPGPWMNAVNRFFGVLLLGVAIWLISPVIPLMAQMLAWAALLILPAIYLHALDPLPPRAHGWQKLGKGLGVISLLLGAALLMGALGGSRDPLQPLGFLRGNATPHTRPTETPTHFTRIKTLTELEAHLKNPSRPVLLDFYADWCVSCKEMERLTFADPQVAAQMNRMQLLQVDVTEDTADDRALLKRFELFGPPGIIFFNAQGQENHDLRVIGFQPAETFLPILQQIF
ncbi:MAG: protein-disulfide reductase DsbD [Sterolibacterium sp.]|jgi:thiol:disulfide interchange protein DsbD|nr:protein-disulfide reductase DsbD [Sterolibacterium sp.]